MTIFGQSLDIECDKHIIEALKKSNITKLAYGIYDIDRQMMIKQEIRAAFHGSQLEIEFYDSRDFFQCLSNLEWGI